MGVGAGVRAGVGAGGWGRWLGQGLGQGYEFEIRRYYTESNLETQTLVNKSLLISYRLKRFDTLGF